MEVDGGGDESAAPSAAPSDGEDYSSDEDDDGWAVSDSSIDEEDEEEDQDQGTHRPFTVDDFPRVSSDHFEQTHKLYEIPDIRLRGPSPFSLFRTFKDPLVEKRYHWFRSSYQLEDESEIGVDNVRTNDCSKRCICRPRTLLQFFDLKIAGYRHTQPGRAKIFGFFAARDQIKPLRNYVYKREIDNYEAITVKRKTGTARLSLVSPARGICMAGHVYFEFKLCIRTEDQPEDGPKDELLIEGCTEFTDIWSTKSYTKTGRFYGEKCGLDLKFAMLVSAVQAKVDIEILHAPACGLDLNLYAKTSGFEDVIRLFRGDAKAGSRFSSVVAVMIHSYLYLCVKGSSNDEGLCERSPLGDDGLGEKLSCYMWEGRFYSSGHGTADEMVKLDDLAKISVKVTWNTIEERHVLKA